MASSLLSQRNDSAQSLKELFEDITAPRLMRGVLSILLAYGLTWLVIRFTTWLSEKVPRRFRLFIKQAVPFLKGIILIVVASYLIQLFVDLSATNLIALTGTVAVALGFAFKDYVSSIIAGVVTLFEGSVRMGDRVKIGDYYGELVDYGLRGMRLLTPDDSTITIPHSAVWTEAISSANSGRLEAQVITNLYFSHQVDVETVTEILYQAAYSSRFTQLKLPVAVLIDAKPWGTEFKLKSYPMDARDEFVYKTDLIRRTKQTCDRLQISYPDIKLPLAAD
ncbi:mechanosensitive ion channel family protein [Vacuolonema iberomarrocanum]|uniref:mechanosensitive ion channel family protein n=1 Tax=Vacuolonema iberomarrocanum TaxID=3454632 RepID=UPI003F6DCE61